LGFLHMEFYHMSNGNYMVLIGSQAFKTAEVIGTHASKKRAQNQCDTDTRYIGPHEKRFVLTWSEVKKHMDQGWDIRT